MGLQAIDPLVSLVLGGADFDNDPFIREVLDESSRRLFANQGARGKLGSGETIEDLVSTTFLVGDQRVNQLLGLVDRGQAAAGGQAEIDFLTGQGIAGLQTDRGAVRAGGVVGAANARAAGTQNIIDLGFRVAGQFTGGGGGGGSALSRLNTTRPRNMGGFPNRTQPRFPITPI